MGVNKGCFRPLGAELAPGEVTPGVFFVFRRVFLEGRRVLEGGVKPGFGVTQHYYIKYIYSAEVVCSICMILEIML